MNFYILTLFPDMVREGLHTSIIGRAVQAGHLAIETVRFGFCVKLMGEKECRKW